MFIGPFSVSMTNKWEYCSIMKGIKVNVAWL